jgi:hypothetical protein
MRPSLSWPSWRVRQSLAYYSPIKQGSVVTEGVFAEMRARYSGLLAAVRDLDVY